MFTMIKERVGVDSCNARTMVEYIRVCVRNESYVDILDVTLMLLEYFDF